MKPTQSDYDLYNELKSRKRKFNLKYLTIVALLIIGSLSIIYLIGQAPTGLVLLADKEETDCFLGIDTGLVCTIAKDKISIKNDGGDRTITSVTLGHCLVDQKFELDTGDVLKLDYSECKVKAGSPIVLRQPNSETIVGKFI
jgi:hypothetical protein